MFLSRTSLLIGSAGLLLGLGSLAWLGAAPRGQGKGDCESCHAMTPQHASWRRGNHAKEAACRDCHLPQGASVHRSQAVAADGLRHAAMAALGATPPVIRLHGPGAEVVQANCLRCHPRSAGEPSTPGAKPSRPLPQPTTAAHADPHRACSECHRETSHAR